MDEAIAGDFGLHSPEKVMEAFQTLISGRELDLFTSQLLPSMARAY